MTTSTLTGIDLEKSYTVEEFIALPENGKLYELVKGKLVEMAGANEKHCRISSRIQMYLAPYVFQNGLGEVYGSDARYTTVPSNPPTVRQADVSFVQVSRVTPDVYTMPYAPDLAIEVTSESNSFSEIEEKAREYLRAGGQLVWVIEPEPQEVHIYHAGSRQRLTLSYDDELDGENVVPGFKLKISALFESVKPKQP